MDNFLMECDRETLFKFTVFMCSETFKQTIIEAQRQKITRFEKIVY